MNKIVLIILAIFLPPLAVYLKTNSGKDTIINLILDLEETFGIVFDYADVQEANFKTIGDLVVLLETKYHL